MSIHRNLGKAALALSLLAGSSAPVWAATGVGGTVEVTSQTSDKEKIDYTRTALAEMDAALKRADKLLETAERDTGPDAADKVQCVRLKQASIRTVRQVSEGASNNMNDAIADGDAGLADFEFRKITVSMSKVRELIAEAEACMGETGAADGTTDVDVKADGVTDAEETESLTGDLGVIGVDPPGISPLE